MSTRMMTATFSAMTIAGTLTLHAQAPNPQTQPRPTQPQAEQPRTQQPAPQSPTPQTQTDQQRATAGTQSASNAAERILTLTGCLQAEKDVPGRRESVTERAGMGEDYILTNVKMGQGAATSGIGLGSMYQLKGGSVKESELKNHLGHQVEVTGSIENMSDIRGGMAGRSTGSTSGTGGTTAGSTSGTTAGSTTGTEGRGARTGATTAEGNSNLPNFEATSIKMIAATCPAR
jgi:hypothetical protein